MMMEDESASESTAISPPEPEKTGTEPDSQKAGIPDVTVLPSVRTGRLGLREASVADLFSAVISQSGQQLQDVLKIIGGGFDRRLIRSESKIEKLQKELEDEKIAHAETRTRLAALLVKDRKSAFLNTLGGILVGYGLSHWELDQGKGAAVIGAILIVVGSLRLLPGAKD